MKSPEADFTACVLYNNTTHPDGMPKFRRDRIISQRDDLAERLEREGGSLAIAQVMDWEGNPDTPVQLQWMRHPRFESHRSTVMCNRMAPISVAEFNEEVDVVLDRCSENPGIPKPFVHVPKINEAPVQAYGKNKFRAYLDILDPLDVAIPTVLLSDFENITLDQLSGEDRAYFVKPLGGGFGVGVQKFTSAQDLRDWKTSQEADNPQVGWDYIVQQACDFTYPIPGIQPYSKQDADSLRLNDQPVAKELRMYTFVREGVCREQFGVPFAVGQKEGQLFKKAMWTDPDSIPDELYEKAAAVSEEVARRAGVRALYGAADFGFGTLPFEERPSWRVIEVNLDFPGLRTPRQHPEVGPIVSDKFVRHAKALARRS